MSEEERAGQLLSGPRGRRLCQELLLTPGDAGLAADALVQRGRRVPGRAA